MQIINILKVKDHAVSGEQFDLIKNQTYGFLETVPQPTKHNLSAYYKSENYISHTDSRRNLFEKAYHIIRSFTLRNKQKLINSYNFKEKRLLDIGCGTGDFLKAAQDKHWLISGIEPNEDARTIANLKTNNRVFSSDQLLKFDKHSFDVITLWHVFEHLPDLVHHVAIFKKLLKKEGVLIIAAPNYKSFDADYYQEYWAAYDVPRHLWHFDQKAMGMLFEKQDMKICDTHPMKFDAYYVSILSEKYKSGKMNLIKALFVAFLSNINAWRTGEYSSLTYIIKNN